MGFDFLDFGFPKSGTDWKSINGKPFITVSSKGRSNRLSTKINDGADFGPDTTQGATSPNQIGAPYSTTLGIEEANNYMNANGLTSVKAIGNFDINTTITLSGQNVVIDFSGANFTHGTNDLFHLNNFNNSKLLIGKIQSNGGNSIIIQSAYLNLIEVIELNGSDAGDAIQNNPSSINANTNDNEFIIGVINAYENDYHQVSPPSGYTGDNQGTVIYGSFFNGNNTVAANGILIDSGVSNETFIEFFGVIDMANTTIAGWKDINEQGGGNNLYIMKYINDIGTHSNVKLTSTVINQYLAGQLSLLTNTKILFGADQANPSSIDQEGNTLVMRTSNTSNPVGFAIQNISGTNSYFFNPSNISVLYSVPTKGLGISAIYGLDNRKSITTADASPITLYTTTASGQVYKVNARILATSGVAATYVISWTEDGTARTVTLTVSATGTEYAESFLIQPDSGTAITAQITSITSSTVNVATTIEQVA